MPSAILQDWLASKSTVKHSEPQSKTWTIKKFHGGVKPSKKFHGGVKPVKDVFAEDGWMEKENFAFIFCVCQRNDCTKTVQWVRDFMMQKIVLCKLTSHFSVYFLLLLTGDGDIPRKNNLFLIITDRNTTGVETGYPD